MPSVTDPEAFAQRVKYAAACIIAGRSGTRRYDSCFEAGDGDTVAVAVYRRSLNNPKLAARIWDGLGRESVMRAVEKLRDVPTRKLAEAAGRERAAWQRQSAGRAEGRTQSVALETQAAAAATPPALPPDTAREQQQQRPPHAGR